ncbi:DNA polymerase ligase N-terminal domain-containing protein [Streptomyces sp. NPDC055955]|uniref:DNA polymerase ligase N-terminal domain-containing protein n=1 Tax=Streptomyces sp. NPDC055955 TaxID=3345665 RepID=UPI0035D95BC8
MSEKDKLSTYRAKRHFDRTREPIGERATKDEAPPTTDEEPTFVVQIHRSTEVLVGPEGALPRPAGNKRLAIPTEDHPLDYGDFEGLIPKGEYGGGTVIVWDRGTYRPTSHDKRNRPVPFGQALEDGHATFELHGKKLHGRYALTRFRGREEASGEAPEKATWLLVRTGHGHGSGGSTPDPRRARSARSGRTLRQVAEAPDAPTWEASGGERK